MYVAALGASAEGADGVRRGVSLNQLVAYFLLDTVGQESFAAKPLPDVMWRV